MKKINKLFTKYSDQVFKTYIVMAITIVICLAIILMINICSLNPQQDYVAYDVIAATDETYILQECDDKEHYIEVDQSEMYGVGETVICAYDDGQITSVWLYVDC